MSKQTDKALGEGLGEGFQFRPGTPEGAAELEELQVDHNGRSGVDGASDDGEQVATPVTAPCIGRDGGDILVFVLEYKGAHYCCKNEGSWQEEYYWQPLRSAQPVAAYRVQF